MENYNYPLYYKGEIKGPYENEKKKMYWNYESLYFVCNKNPNEKEFKEYIIQIIDKLSEYFL